jgi:hypothetical protein
MVIGMPFMRRRSFMIGGAAVTAMVGTAMTARGNDGFAVEIHHGGQSFRYEEAAGIDLGDYVDPQGRFVQGCVRTVRNDFPVTVMFRPDRRGDRREIVFELGDPWSPNPINLDAYHVRIFRGTSVISEGTVPKHYWFSRWRWHTGARKITARPKELIEKRLLPAFDPALARYAPSVRATRYTLMGLAGITPYMPTTGERDDIGPVTEAQGEYICTENIGALATLLAQAEAAGTVPWSIRDPKTAAPIDVMKYSGASLYGEEEGHPYIRGTKTSVHPDSAHQPALAYLPFLLTGDPYHLETLQFQAIWNVLSRPPHYRYSMGEVRGTAWSMRTLGEAARITPDAVPRWFLPRTFFGRLLDSYRDWLIRDFVDSPAAARSVFRTSSGNFGDRTDGRLEAGTYIAPWEEEFQTFIFGWLVQMGHEDWKPIFRWKLGSTLARTDGKSGWARAICSPYRIQLRATRQSPWMQSWAEAWRLNVARQGWQPTYPDHWHKGDLSYFSYTRGVLAIAHQLGVAEAMPSLAWVDAEWRRIMRPGSDIRYKWAIAGS